jgi:putative methionine-R-sulfoxide reductase with GAF domain
MSKLYFINGPEKGESVGLVRDRIYIGRSPDNDIQIQDMAVSRNHLKVMVGEGRYYIEDLKSRNGTYIKGEPVKPGKKVEVGAGIPITLGRRVISLGQPYSGQTWVIKESRDLSKMIGNHGRPFLGDRPLTARKNMELIYKVGEILKDASNINKGLEEILNQIFDLLKRIDRAVFILVDRKTGEYSKVIIKFKKGAKDDFGMYSRTIVDRVLREGEAVIVLDTGEMDETDFSKSMALMRVKSVMCVPLISRGEIRGVIYIDSVTSSYGFRGEDLALITALSSPAAIAVENQSLYSALASSKPPENHPNTLN